MFDKLRPLFVNVWVAPAKLLLRLGVHPNAVTIVGTLGVVLGALLLMSQPGKPMFWGVMVVTFFVLTDVIDGTMARLSGKASRLGSFLDSTLDRVADAAVFGALVWAYGVEHPLTSLAALLCLTIGSFVPYTRAKAESLGVKASMGIAGRGDRLLFGLTAAGLVGLGQPLWILTWTLFALSAAAAFTVGQRTYAVIKANQEDPRLDVDGLDIGGTAPK